MTKRNLRILADSGIPDILDALKPFGAVALLPGPQIQPSDLRSVDVLVVRSVTQVDRRLLDGSPVALVASATAGIDHVDVDWLATRGVQFQHAPGANAESVGDYVIAALLRLAKRTDRTLRGLTAGIIGCGQVGGRLVPRLQALGLNVLKNDPPREAQFGESDFVSLDTILLEADIVTSHVPLTTVGAYPTHHLMGASELGRMKAGAWLLNTARGAVVDNRALESALDAGRLEAILDVWETEPAPSPQLVSKVAIATPHIAGYARDSKDAATAAVVRAVAAFAGGTAGGGTAAGDTAAGDSAAANTAAAAHAPTVHGETSLIPLHVPIDTPEAAWLHTAAHLMYPIDRDDQMLRGSLLASEAERALAFDAMRRAYPERRLFSRHTMPREAVPDALRRQAAEGLRIVLEVC